MYENNFRYGCYTYLSEEESVYATPNTRSADDFVTRESFHRQVGIIFK